MQEPEILEATEDLRLWAPDCAGKDGEWKAQIADGRNTLRPAHLPQWAGGLDWHVHGSVHYCACRALAVAADYIFCLVPRTPVGLQASHGGRRSVASFSTTPRTWQDA